MNINSNKVLRFSGEGAVTKILVMPSYRAAATMSPTAADLPLPLAAVMLTVYLKLS